MTIEEDLLKKSNVDFNKLLKYGFVKENKEYIYSKEIMNNNFLVKISINTNGKVFGKVFDKETNEEYTNFRINASDGSFSSRVRESYKEILIDIKNNCFDNKNFTGDQTNRISSYITNKYGDKPEFLWEKLPNCAIFRNKSNHKWYGIIMNIDKSKLDNERKEVEIINVKLDDSIIPELITKEGYYKAYHMNKKNWITIILDDTVEDKEIIKCIDESYNIINSNS